MVALPKISKTMVKTTVPVSPAPSLKTPVTVLPSDFIIRAPGRLAVSFGGSGSVQSVVGGVHPITASFGGSALVAAGDLVQVMDTAPEFGGAGGMSAVTVTYLSTSATFGGTGEFVAEAEEFTGLPVSFGGSAHIQATSIPYSATSFGGTGGVQLGTGIKSAFGGEGGLSTNLGLTGGTAGAMFGGSGGLQVVVTSFKPSGMNKSGSMAMPQSYAVITGWVADTANYPGSTVSGNGLVVQDNISNATLMAQLQVTKPGNSQSSVIDIRFYKNGTTLLGTAPSPGTTVPAGATTLVQATLTGVSLAAGDVITIHSQKTTAFGATVDAANSWVRVLQP